jgi:hypothetical protein
MKKGPGLPGPFYFLAEEAVLALLTAIPANPLAAAALASSSAAGAHASGTENRSFAETTTASLAPSSHRPSN